MSYSNFQILYFEITIALLVFQIETNYQGKHYPSYNAILILKIVTLHKVM